MGESLVQLATQGGVAVVVLVVITLIVVYLWSKVFRPATEALLEVTRLQHETIREARVATEKTRDAAERIEHALSLSPISRSNASAEG